MQNCDINSIFENEWYTSLPDSKKHLNFLMNVYKLLVEEAVFKGTSRQEPVIQWKSPENLNKIFDFNPKDDPLKEEELLQIIKNTVKYSVKTGHPYFINQLFSSVDVYGFVGQLVTDALNCSVYTYEVAPVFTLMEKSVIDSMISLIGWNDGDGIFCPGGSVSNGIGINLSRFYYDNDMKYSGMSDKARIVIFASRDAHFSIRKMAALLGLGENNVIQIITDDDGRMDVNHLKKSIKQAKEQGAIPIATVATSGTTVLGAFDPLNAIADICIRNNMWLHVDAAWGGGLIFSKTYKNKLNGLHRADSIAINPHKLLAVPQQCSLLLTKHKDILSRCHAAHASYLFQPDKFYDTNLDCGDSHIQCGRRPDVFKFWFMWMAKGTSGFEKHVDTIMETSTYFVNCIKNRPNMILVNEPQYINVCFWYIPPSLKNVKQIDLNNSEHKEKLHKIAPKIKERMILKGSMMLNYQPLREKPNFFRFVTQNSGLNKNDVAYILDEIESLGSDL